VSYHIFPIILHKPNPTFILHFSCNIYMSEVMLTKLKMWTPKKNSSGKPTWKEHTVDPFHLHEKHQKNNNNNSYSFNVRKLLSKHSSNEVFEFAKNIFDGILMKSNADKCNKTKTVNIKLKGIVDSQNPEHDLIVTIRNSDRSRVVLHKQLSWIEKEIDTTEQILDASVTVDKADETVKDDVCPDTDDSWTPYFGMRRNNSLRRKPLQRSRTLPLKENTYDNYSLQLQRRHTYEITGTRKKSERRKDTSLEDIELPNKSNEFSTSVFDNKAFEPSPDEAIEVPPVSPESDNDYDKSSCEDIDESPDTIEANRKDENKINSCWERHKASMRDNGNPCNGNPCNGNPRMNRPTTGGTFSRRVDNFHMFGCKQTRHLTRSPTFLPGLGCGFLEYPYADAQAEIRCV
jgi:hypothetical protein